MVGEYVNAYTPVNCICSKGHPCKPAPRNIQQGCGMCGQCPQSRGEQMLWQAIKELSFVPAKGYHASIPDLEYDCYIMYKDVPVYIEYHGIQHEKPIPLFHKNSDFDYRDDPELLETHMEENFEYRRQLDLLKIHVAKKNGIKMIILDHTWVKKSMEEWVTYLRESLESDRMFIVDSELHDWCHEEPSDETLKRLVTE